MQRNDRQGIETWNKCNIKCDDCWRLKEILYDRNENDPVEPLKPRSA